MDDNQYAWDRFGVATSDKPTYSIYAKDGNNALANVGELVLDSSNIEYLSNLIIARADPLRNGPSVGQFQTVRRKVEDYLLSWKTLGKFEKDTVMFEGKTYLIKTMSRQALMDHYNMEFIKVYADSILPIPDIVNVQSVVNPNGLFAQQERIITIKSKPVPFYERALYRRLTDRNLEQRIDETEMPFYKMDHNPNIGDQERKKRETDRSETSSYLDREGLSYRMNPNH